MQNLVRRGKSKKGQKRYEDELTFVKEIIAAAFENAIVNGNSIYIVTEEQSKANEILKGILKLLNDYNMTTRVNRI